MFSASRMSARSYQNGRRGGARDFPVAAPRRPSLRSPYYSAAHADAARAAVLLLLLLFLAFFSNVVVL